MTEAGPGGTSRVWTVDEANAALGWVSDVVARAQGLWDDYRLHTVRRVRLTRENGHGQVPPTRAPSNRASASWRLPGSSSGT